MSSQDTPPSLIGPQRKPVTRIIREVIDPDPVHPALVPGIGVEQTGRSFRTNWWVFGVAGAGVVAVIAWALLDPESISAIGSVSLDWVTENFGWLFSALTIIVAVFMLVVGYGRTGGVRLGADDETPEFSRVSWTAMLFSAGIGIGLLFYGPMEPLTYFLAPPHGFDVEPGTVDAMHTAIAQTVLHWGPMAWAYYALVGGAIAYAAYRRGRPPLISALFDSVFSQRTQGWFGPLIDIFAILVTLFGTAVSLGIGALQIASGVEMVTGIGELGNGFIIGAIAVLTALFILSAVSGVKRGIRVLSNVNMVVAGLLGVFVLIAGPTLLLLNIIPSAGVAFFSELGTMLMRNPSMGEDTEAFMQAWTTYYWAWWVSWTPFVGLFIAKISRGRTLREFVTVVVVVPSAVCLVWFGIVGGTTMWMEMQGTAVSEAGSPEAQLFTVLAELPFGAITSVVALVSIVIFFVTSADSASIVMGSMSQVGKPEPSRWVTIFWGLMLGLIAASLLLAGGRDALSGLQAIMVVTALPFAFVVMGIMWAWAKDLRTDPYMMRRRYAREAIDEGVRAGIAEHGDDFVFGASVVEAEHGAGAWLDSEDPALTEWYTDATTGMLDVVKGEEASTDGEASTPSPESGEQARIEAPASREALESGGAERDGDGDADGDGDRDRVGV
ncbi:BCCT family transporter [Pseudoclavibacter sp. VKM Ac-2867]|uniref:BCCT family transporter n=1 Tax=Pseudoclavibacter sp. VKM Ac-2867 TaxID=2783829 RepID=UPI00188C8F65|nr:BCCT family transporter [Pseudoclavibacter sp. VKM Ac-2867]MBF4459997.1 BCCT family transporter [Pseudoclavibacter sp. VKM Ac-2867]